MRRVSMIFYFENHRNGNAVRRCLSGKIIVFNAYRLNPAKGSFIQAMAMGFAKIGCALCVGGGILDAPYDGTACKWGVKDAAPYELY